MTVTGENTIDLGFTARPEPGVNRREIPTFPQKSTYLDKRFFSKDGQPTLRLKESVKKVQTALNNNGVRNYRIFLVGGVVSTQDNSNYKGDSDFYIQSKIITPQLNSGFTKQTALDGPNSLAYKLVYAVNGFVPSTPIEAKREDYIDIMISPELPYHDWPFYNGEQKFYYDPISYKSYTIEKPIESPKAP